MASYLETSRPASVGQSIPPFFSWRAQRALWQVRTEAALGVARVRGQAAIQSARLEEIDNLCIQATHGQNRLVEAKDIVAGPDPIKQDNYDHFCQVARWVKGELILTLGQAWGSETRS